MDTTEDYQFQQDESVTQHPRRVKKRSFLFLFIIIFLTVGFFSVLFVTKQNYSQQIKILEQEKQMCMDRPVPIIQESNAEVSFGDLAISSHRLQTVVNATPGKVFYSAFIEKVTADTYNILIKMEGYPESVAFAADFSLSFDPQLVEVIKITPQDAFPSYPRAQVLGKTVMVTGVSEIVGNTMNFGRPNTDFVIIRVRNKVPDKVQTLTVVEDKTHVFYQTQDLLDKERSIEIIEI